MARRSAAFQCPSRDVFKVTDQHLPRLGTIGRSHHPLQSRILLEIKDNEGRFGPKFNDNESELYFIVTGVIKEKDRLKNLFDLFVLVINELEMIGITVNQTPEVNLYKE